jgi:hypothetical protein
MSSVTWIAAITRSDYDSLLRQMETEVQRAAFDKKTFLTRAHAADFGLVNQTLARIVGMGSCSNGSDCEISIYGCELSYSRDGTPQCNYWPMLRDVKGYAVANTSDYKSDVFAPRVSFVIARHNSQTEAELKRYSVITDSIGPHPGDKLVPDACEIVKSKRGSVPSDWTPESLIVASTTCADFAAAK